MARTEYACWACGRIVAPESVVLGLGGTLGRCPCSDREAAPLKLRPVGDVETVAAARERRAADTAYRRAKLKSQTPEGRAKMTQREASELAKRDAARPT